MPCKVVPREFTGDASSLRSRSERMVSALVGLGCTHVVGIPDNATRILFELLSAHQQVQVVPVCREGEAWAIASGLWVGGKQPVVIIQNTGFLESGDGYRGTAYEMEVPLLVVMDYRGYHTLSHSDPNHCDSAARFFEPTMKAWNLAYYLLNEGEEEATLKAALAKAQKLGRPVAAIMA